ncbi:MAG: class I SAM-dependent methyltransferase [Sphingobium phenoxybenzoativorans]
MDIPGHGTVNGEWDLRGRVGEYLGNFDFSGCRVLDVGAASGILTYHMEQQGADVVSFDLSEDYDWDIVPFFENNTAAMRAQRRQHLRAINNGYWFCHQALKSRARMVNGVVYDIPEDIGPVDVAVYGSILLHLRDPFLALENGARLAQKTMIVADVSPWSRFMSRFRKTSKFMPSHLKPKGISDGWHRLPPLLVKEYLAILGFKDSSITWRKFDYAGRSTPIYTIIANR